MNSQDSRNKLVADLDRLQKAYDSASSEAERASLNTEMRGVQMALGNE